MPAHEHGRLRDTVRGAFDGGAAGPARRPSMVFRPSPDQCGGRSSAGLHSGARDFCCRDASSAVVADCDLRPAAEASLRRPPLKKRREEMSRHAAPDVVEMYEVVCCCHIAVLDLSSVFIPREPTRRAGPPAAGFVTRRREQDPREGRRHSLPLSPLSPSVRGPLFHHKRVRGCR